MDGVVILVKVISGRNRFVSAVFNVRKVFGFEASVKGASSCHTQLALMGVTQT